MKRSGLETWLPHQGRLAHVLERLALWLEKPVNRLSGTTQLNPFYHTGTISVFLLFIVGLTGFYLYIFFQYGFDASYAAVERLEGMFIGRSVRAMHRYASGALVITALLHAYRMLFMGRFRGARWLAWVTGMIMVALLWAAGVTGYWVIGDVRAQLINEAFLAFLTHFTSLAPSFANWLVSSESGDSYQLFLIVVWVHILLFVLVAAAFIYHIKRLQRPQWFPEIHWVIGMSVVLVAGSVFFPVGMLAKADPDFWPQAVTYDPIFLAFLPTLEQGLWGWAIWGGVLLLFVLATLLPWLPRPRGTTPPPPVRVIEEACTGCTRCAIDCPYNAISIAERPEGSVYKYIAVPHPELCVSCGICIGSCTDDAITLGAVPPERLREVVAARITEAQARQARDIELVFTCERFANQSGRPYLQNQVKAVEATHETIEVIPLPCAGAVQPDLLIEAIDLGAAEVRIIGCPPHDCAHREGNLWAEARLTRERAPKLKRQYANVPISAVWLPPDSFEVGLAASVHEEESNWLETRRLFTMLTWRNLVPAFTLLALVLLVQILFSDLNYRPRAAEAGQVQIIVADLSDPLGPRPDLVSWRPRPDTVTLQLWVDDAPFFEEVLPFEQLLGRSDTPYFKELPLSPGSHHFELSLLDPETGTRHILSRMTAELQAGDILRLSYQEPAPTPCIDQNCLQ